MALQTRRIVKRKRHKRVVRASEKNRRIVIQHNVGKRDADFNIVGEQWENIPTKPKVWAKFMPSPGKIKYEDEQEAIVSNPNFLIDYRNDVTTAMRVVFKGRNYEINDMYEDGYNAGLMLMCELVLVSGEGKDF